MANFITKTFELTGAMMKKGGGATVHFFQEEFPRQLANRQPEAIAFAGLSAHHVYEIGHAVIGGNIPEVGMGVGKFIASKWGYMAFENRKPLTEFAQTALIPEGRQAIGDLSKSIGKDVRHFYRNEPSLTNTFVKNGKASFMQYALDVLQPYIHLYMKSGMTNNVNLINLLSKVVLNEKTIARIKKMTPEQMSKLIERLSKYRPDSVDALDKKAIIDMFMDIKSGL